MEFCDLRSFLAIYIYINQTSQQALVRLTSSSKNRG